MQIFEQKNAIKMRFFANLTVFREIIQKTVRFWTDLGQIPLYFLRPYPRMYLCAKIYGIWQILIKRMLT